MSLINTMVFTHIPSNVLLILVAFAHTFPIAVGFYLARMALSQMDVPTRQSCIVGVVKEDERTAAAGFTNISRNVAQSISPTILGSLFQSVYFLTVPFLLAGVLKIGYDVLLYINFRCVNQQLNKGRYCGRGLILLYTQKRETVCLENKDLDKPFVSPIAADITLIQMKNLLKICRQKKFFSSN